LSVASMKSIKTSNSYWGRTLNFRWRY